jgi:hypothetical protein
MGQRNTLTIFHWKPSKHTTIKPTFDPLATSNKHSGPNPNKKTPKPAQSRYSPGTGQAPHSGRAVKVKSAQHMAEDEAMIAKIHKSQASAKAAAGTRICPTCKATVKGNAWHLNKHMARHK